MPEYTTNPETGRRIQVGGVTFNRLTWESYDYINRELVRRASAPLPSPRTYYLNTATNRLIGHGTRRYDQLIRAGWEIEQDYYLLPPYGSLFRHEIDETLAMVQEAGQEIAPNVVERRDAQRSGRNNSYQRLMAVHGERLAELNITLCRECTFPMKPEDGEYCGECRTI
jgi:hypothetical protein